MGGNFMLAGVMGWPVSHSRSPKIHNFWLAAHGIAGSYVPLAVAPENLAQALRALPTLGFSGCNLTIPHKEAALPLLDVVEPAARAIGAVNCVVVGPDGELIGRNYDAFGFVAALRETAPAWDAVSGPAVVVGAGGAARAIVYGLLEAGAPEIRVMNRTATRAEAIARDFGPRISALPWAERHAALADAALLVNTTSQGMIGNPPLDLSLAALPATATVTDIVYSPLETPLLAAARQKGVTVVDGLGMLLHQARPAFRDWTGVMPEATSVLRALIVETLR
jgi:shikimate dehydrogenase